MQTVHDGRQFLKYVDPRLGVPLPERDYGGNCLIYDADNETDPFHNVWVRASPGWGGAGTSWAAVPGCLCCAFWSLSSCRAGRAPLEGHLVVLG